jgi:hypothetical protein
MSDRRLILVDGIIGSGKSTTAQWLCRLLSAHGEPAEWHHEQDVGHPVFEHHELEAAARMSSGDSLAFHRRALERWREVAVSAGPGRPVVIIESSFLQAPIASMHLAGCSRDVIVGHVAETAQVLRDVPSLLVYLRLRDVAACVLQICERRGPEFGAYLLETITATPYGEQRVPNESTQVTTFIEELAGLCDVAVGRLECDVVSAEVDRESWKAIRARLAGCLDVAAVEPDPEPERDDAGQLVGRYRDIEHDQELRVIRDGDRLVLHPSGTRLLPTAPDRYELEGLSVELTFERVDGAAERIRCQSRMANMGPVWERT